MALLFSGAVTSSPIRITESLSEQSCNSLGLSLLSPDLTYKCLSVNSLTGSPCCCRRSPRLLSNGYYVLTEDSYVCDDHGNVSLTPSKTNVSYKENVVRIFRRRRRSRKSLASLFSMSQSWLGESIFGKDHRYPPPESSWVQGSTSDMEQSCSFAYDHSVMTSTPHKSLKDWLQVEEDQGLDLDTCPKEHLSSLGGFLEVPPPLTIDSENLCRTKPQPADSAKAKAFFMLFLAICLFTAAFPRWLLAGLALAFVVFTLIVLTSLFVMKPTQGTAGKWHRSKTEDISSRNE